MAKVTSGSTVSIHYTGKLSTGATFDTSTDGDPVEVVIGQDQGRFPQALIEALNGMQVGDKKTVQIKADKAFGPHRPELVLEMSRSNLDDSFQPEEGQYYHINQEAATILIKVVGMSDETITMDANHPLAGKDLVYEVEIVSIS